MINWSLYKQGLKSNWKLFLIFISILTLYVAMIISMFNPELAKTLDEFAKTMPELMAVFGMNGETSSLIGFLVTYLYGFLFILFPIIFYIILTNKLIISHTDRGSMAYLLASPNTRPKIIFTQFKVIGTFIFAMIFYITILSIVISQLMFPSQLNISNFIILNIGLFIFHLAISGICFLAACIFNDSKNALLIGSGIPIIFFIIQLLVNMGGKLENLKYATLFTLFDPYLIINGNNNAYIMILSLLIIAIILYIISIIVFKNKDLSV